MMNKILLFLLFVIISPFLSGAYGIISDLLSFSLCPEFFRNLRFAAYGFPSDSGYVAVSEIGFRNGFFIGLFIGIPLTLAGFLHRESGQMRRYVLTSFFICITVAIFFSIAGFVMGKFFPFRSK